MGKTRAEIEREYDILPPDAPFESGFNIRSLWAALFVAIVMLPGSMYLGLLTGGTFGGAAQWVTVILFVEILKRSFVRLRPQEIFIIMAISGLILESSSKMGSAAVMGGPFGSMIWDQYLVQSPQAQGISAYIPTWLAPRPDSDALAQRTFWHSDWAIPIVILVLHYLISKINMISMGYVVFRLTSDIEQLPFPLAYVQASGSMALAETSGKVEGWRWRVFSMGTIIGTAWSLIYIVVPTFSSIFLTDTVTIIPIPFVDFTTSLSALLPASSISIGTDITLVVMAFVIPFWTVVGIFAGFVLRWLVLSPILEVTGIYHRWVQGMSVIPTMIATDLDFWLSARIGGSLVVAILGIWSIVSIFRARARAGASRVSVTDVPEGRGDMGLWLALGIWAVATLLGVLMVWVLVPEFPIWIVAAFGFIMTPALSYIGARMQGITGGAANIDPFPFVREASFYLSGYKGSAIWFAPVPMYGHGWMAQHFRVLEILKTTFGSYVRALLLGMGIILVTSFIFWSFIWQLAPIPSGAYPAVQRFWPYNATWQCLWASSTLEDERWFATDRGAALFDGASWRVYTTQHGLTDDKVNDIAIDSEGAKWFATDSGVSRLLAGRWTKYTQKVDDMPSDEIRGTSVDRSGFKWFATAAGVARFDDREWLVMTAETHGLPSNDVRWVRVDREGSVWAGTDEGLARIDAERQVTVFDDKTGLGTKWATTIAQDKRGNQWVGTEEGVARLSSDGRWERLGTQAGLAGLRVTSIAVDSSDAVWVGTDNGLSRFDGETWRSYSTDESPLVDDRILSLEVDRSNVLWVQTASGISRYDGVSWRAYGPEKSGLPSGAVSDLAIQKRVSLIEGAIHWDYIAISTAAFAVLYAILAASGASMGFFYGIVAGTNVWPFIILPQLIGALLGRYYFRKRLGEETWLRYAPIIGAGMACGVGIVAMISIAVALISLSISQVVF